MHVEIDGCFFCKRVVIGTRDGNNRGTLTNDSRDDSQQLGCGAGVRNRNDDIVFGDHAQIAVSCFYRKGNLMKAEAIAKKIKLVCLDVDGVLTDGSIIISGQGELFKQFYVRDGLGIKFLQDCGIQVAICTGRQSDIVIERAKELGITLSSDYLCGHKVMDVERTDQSIIVVYNQQLVS